MNTHIVDFTDTCENITFPRTSYAGGKNITKLMSDRFQLHVDAGMLAARPR